MSEADSNSACQSGDLLRLHTRNAAGQMTRSAAFVTTHETTGPEQTGPLQRRADGRDQWRARPCFDRPQARRPLEAIVAKGTCRPAWASIWTELTYQQFVGKYGEFVFPLCVLLAFLVLVHSTKLELVPLVVIPDRAMCLFSAAGGVQLTGGDNNVVHPESV